MKMKQIATFSLSVLLSLVTGCSLLVPSHQMMSIQTSEPHGKVWVNGGYEGEAPVHTSVMRNHSVGVLVKKEGFQTSSKIVDYHLNTTGILDIVGTCLFLVPGIGLVSPGAFSLDETTLMLQLSPEEKPAPTTNAPPVTAH